MPAATVRLDEPVAGLAALCAGALAGFAVAVDGVALPAATGSATGPIVFAVAAVLAVAGLQRSGSRRTAWLLAAGCTVVLGTVRFAVPAADPDTLTVLPLISAGAAGILLGAAVAAAWGEPIGQWAVVVGAWAVFLLAGPMGTSLQSSALPSPLQWPLAVAAGAVVLAAFVAGAGARVQRPEARLPIVAVGATAALTVGMHVLAGWVGEQATSAAAWMWLAAAAVLAATVLGAEAVGRFLPFADGRFPVAAIGATAAAYPLVDDLAGREVSAWVPAAGVLAVAAGAALAWRVPRVELGLGVALVVTLTAALWPDTAADGPQLLVRVALVAAGTGLALGAALPGAAPVAAMGLVLPVAAATVATVWALPADPRLLTGALAATGAVCAWRCRS